MDDGGSAQQCALEALEGAWKVWVGEGKAASQESPLNQWCGCLAGLPQLLTAPYAFDDDVWICALSRMLVDVVRDCTGLMGVGWTGTLHRTR